MKRYCLIMVVSFLFGEAISQEMTFTSIEPVPTIKRGREYQINWQGGTQEETVTIVLTDKRSREVVIATEPNTGRATVRIPSRIQIGSHAIKIVNQTSGETTPSGEIKVKRRVPLVLQLAPLVVVPAAILLIKSADPQMIDDLPTAPPDLD